MESRTCMITGASCKTMIGPCWPCDPEVDSSDSGNDTVVVVCSMVGAAVSRCLKNSNHKNSSSHRIYTKLFNKQINKYNFSWFCEDGTYIITS